MSACGSRFSRLCGGYRCVSFVVEMNGLRKETHRRREKEGSRWAYVVGRGSVAWGDSNNVELGVNEIVFE